MDAHRFLQTTPTRITPGTCRRWGSVSQAAPARTSSYRHLLNLQLPEQHWPFWVQLANLGLHETQPLVSYVHVEASQVRVPPPKPRLAQEAPSDAPASHCSVPSTTPLPHTGVQSAAQLDWLSEGSHTSSPQKPQSRQHVAVEKR